MDKEIEELLPFYVNGTLNDAETARVEEKLAHDPDLQKELEFLRALHRNIKNTDIEQNAPGELGLKRLQKSIRDEAAQSNMRPSAARQPSSRWRIAAIAACALLFLQTAVTLPMWKDNDILTAASGTFSTVPAGQIVEITFVPTAREENIRALLLSIDATIIEGPSALGLYKLSIAKDIDGAVLKLKSRKNLIETVELNNRFN